MLNKEQKKQRYFVQVNNAQILLDKSSLVDYIDGLKYCYSLSIRYRSVNLKNIINKNINDVNKPNFDKCLQAGILVEWNNTYYFNKEKAESLQLFIQEYKQKEL